MSIPSAATEAEARQADVAFQLALAQVGAGALEDALSIWQAMDPTSAADAAGFWVEEAVHLILTRRRLSRDLAMAYYRLARALRTGRTIRDPFGPPEPKVVTIGMLRREFARLVEDIDVMHSPGGVQAQESSDEATETLAEDAETPDPAKQVPDDDTDAIPLDDLEGLAESELESEAIVEKLLTQDLTDVGPALFESQLKQIDDQQKAADARAQEAELEAAAALRAARETEKAVLNGGRSSVYQYAQRDKLVIAWARVSLSGDPCYFCAMLISRGAVFKSNSAGTRNNDGDLYHTNCRCVAIPIYSESQFDTDPRYEQSRVLARKWTKGMSLKEWRALIDEERRAGTPEWVAVHPSNSPAQEAG